MIREMGSVQQDSPLAKPVETAVFRKRYSKIIAQTLEKSSTIAGGRTWEKWMNESVGKTLMNFSSSLP